MTLLPEPSMPHQLATIATHNEAGSVPDVALPQTPTVMCSSLEPYEHSLGLSRLTQLDLLYVCAIT